MRSRSLGRTGLQVGEIGLGAWQFGAPEWAGPDEAESGRIVDQALALGCNFIDTAPPYARGRSETLVGTAIAGRRDQFVICTKFGYSAQQECDYRADAIESSVEASLKRLRTDYLDILLLHSPPRELMNGSAPHYAILDRLREQGVIRHYGVSLREGNCDELRDVVKTTGSDVVEVRFNVLCQEPADAIAEAGEAGVGIVVNVPLESGWLSGKYGAGSRFEGSRDRWSVAEIERRARLVAQFAELLPDDVSTPHGALRFILAQPGVATIIPGTKSVAQLRENIAAADGVLPAESLAAIRQLWASEIEAEPVPW